MSKILFLWAVLCGLLSFSACEKPDLHENLVIEGNVAPPHESISALQLDHFVNKLYIDLLGRGPTDVELAIDVQTLRDGEYSMSTRAEIAAGLQDRYEYIKNYDALTRQRILANLDSVVLVDQLNGFLATAAGSAAIGDTVRANLYYWKARNLEDLQYAAVLLLDGEISIAEYYYRNIFNPYYDGINMGAENFALSCYENLFYREPTESELHESVVMIYGFEAFVLLGDGNSKSDFVRLCVDSHHFCEGLVIEAYRSLLAREPTSEELGTYGTLLYEGADWKEVQLNIIQSYEYAGF